MLKGSQVLACTLSVVSGAYVGLRFLGLDLLHLNEADTTEDEAEEHRARIEERIHETHAENSVAEIVRQRILLTCRVTRELSCTAAEPFDQALAACEKLQASDGRPLFGIPISVKDNVDLRGTPSTCGLATRRDLKAEDGDVAQRLKKAGAIIITKSNVPQAMMLPESVNRVWGQCCNPWNSARTAGGSSGGEGVLVATGCTDLGIGTDIGGSLRIPAVWCGVCGFSPTARRVSTMGCATLSSAKLDILTSVGPIARRVENLKRGMAALCANSQDALQPPLPWRDVTLSPQSVRIGYFEETPYFEVCPSVRRAMREAQAALEKVGCVLVRVDPPDMYKYVQLYYGLMSSEGGMRSFHEALQGEPLLEQYRTLSHLARLPPTLRTLGALALHLHSPRMAQLLQCTGQKTVYEYQRLAGERRTAQQAFYEEYFQRHHVHALLYPGPALPAVPHGMSRRLTPSLCYTFMANLLELPTVVLPVTRVREDEQHYETQHCDAWSSAAHDVMEHSVGMPVGVQLSALPYQDEMCLHVADILQTQLGVFAPPPTSFKGNT